MAEGPIAWKLDTDDPDLNFIEVERKDENGQIFFAIRGRWGSYMNKDAEWEYAPVLPEAFDDFKDKCWFNTFEAVNDIVKEYAIKIKFGDIKDES